MIKNTDNIEGRFVIRRASADDAETAVRFIKMLGEYQKMGDSVAVDEEKFVDLIENRGGEAIIGELDDKPVAFMYYYRDSASFIGEHGAYIDVFVIDPEYRGTGIGKKMMRYVSKEVLDDGGGRLQWLVMSWNDPAKRFYEHIGGKHAEILQVYRMDRENMIKLCE